MTREKLPVDTDTMKYLAWSQWEEISLYELMEYAELFFPSTDPRDIKIDKVEIQFRCFGYDLHDSADYRWYITFEKVGQ